jgi:DNA-binding LytR/AlgR family response regulator
MSLKILLADDEFPAREELRCILEDIGNVEIVGECANGEEALKFLQKNKVDAVFLDIAMPGKSGTEVARQLSKMPMPPAIIFSTGFSEFAVEAFALNALDYVLKPYTQERIELTLSRLTAGKIPQKSGEETLRTYNHGMLPSKMAFWHKDRLLLFEPESEIYFFKSENRKTLVYTQKHVLESNMTLKAIEEQVRGKNFLRVHKSYIVNLKMVKEILPSFNDTYALKLQEYPSEDIPVSRHFIPEFKKACGM